MAQAKQQSLVEPMVVLVDRNRRIVWSKLCDQLVYLNVATTHRRGQLTQSLFYEMAFTLWALIEAVVLLVNAVAILSEERFLKPIGWGYRSPNELDPENVKDKIITFISAVRMLMRIPLIFINTLVVLMELLLG